MLAQKNEQERLAKVERLDALLSEVEKAQQKTAAIHNWTATIRKYLNVQELDRAITFMSKDGANWICMESTSQSRGAMNILSKLS